jgi:hypothetical protein
MDASDVFVISPNPWLLAAYAAWWLFGGVTAAKGRWGWLVVGLLLGGLIWPLTAVLLRPAPGSLWARVVRRRAGGP